MARFRSRRKRFRRRRRPFSRRRFRSRGKMRMSRPRPETKFFIASLTSNPILPTGTSPHLLTGTGLEGASETEYVGSRISPKLIQLNCTFRTDTDGGSAAIRWYVVQWFGDHQLDPFTVAKYRTTANVNAFSNYDDRGKFRTLRKGQLVLQRTAPADIADNRAVKVLSLTIRPPRTVSFTSSGLGALMKNHVFFFATSDVGLDPPLLSLFSRLLYTDA